MLVDVNSVLAVVFIAVTVLVGKFGGGFAAFVVNDGVCVVVLAVVISVSYEWLLMLIWLLVCCCCCCC